MTAKKLLRVLPQVGELKKLLATRYGDRLASICVFGSRARGESGEDSDLDLLVLLKEEFDYFDELREIIEVLDVLQRDSPFLISAKPALLSDFNEGKSQLFRNARAEGILV